MDDHEAVAALLGRDPGGNFTVVVRDHDGTPMVIENEPFLRDGTPMPTRYWLVDPELRAEVGRLEASGGVRAAEHHVDGTALAESHRRYAAARGRADPARVGGTSTERRRGRDPRRRQVPARASGLVDGRWRRSGRRVGGATSGARANPGNDRGAPLC